jgi:formate dehydrogenase subunit delta
VDAEHLQEMANQIGKFYASLPNHEEALTGTFSHIRRFWDPRMRRALFAHLDAHGWAGLDPLVREAIEKNRVALEPKPAVNKP